MIRNAALLILALLLTVDAHAQIGAPSPAPVTTAVTLPVSGRSPQNGSVTAVQTPVPGTTTSVNTINPSIQVQGPFTGSSPSTAIPFSGRLSLAEAIERALGYNLGPTGLNEIIAQAKGQSRVSRSVLLPNIAGNITEAVQETNLKALGFTGVNVPIPGFTFPAVVGPFAYTDFRARLTQTLFDFTALNNYRSTQELVRANEQSLDDARDLTVLAVGGAYLQVIAASARVNAAHAQLDTAQALFKQTSDQRSVGLVAQIDVNRSQVQVLTQQQRLVSLQNDLSKQKINLARLTGLPPNDQYDLANDIAFSAPPAVTLDEALQQAFAQRADLKAAQAQIDAAERLRTAARNERLPALAVSADYGGIGPNPAQARPTFTVVGALRIPIWQGGRTEGDISQAEAALAQRRAELADTRGRIESDVRNAFLDLQAATSQVDVAQRNLQVSQETLDLTRQKFEAGVSDNVAVVQSQDAVASAQLDYINSIFAHNVAKLSLARAIGRASESWPRFLIVK